jgi:hypothetical protein
MNDSPLTEIAKDGDIQVVKVTANDVRTNNLGIYFCSGIDEPSFGGTTLDPVIICGANVIRGNIDCSTLIVAGPKDAGGKGVSN